MTLSSKPGVMMQAVWFGLATGLTEALLTGVKQQVLGRYVRVGPDISWMAPAADATAFAVIGFLLMVSGRLWAPFHQPRNATFIFSFLGSMSLLLMYHPIEVYAKVLLALGVAVQIARLTTRWPDLFERVVRRGTVAMTLAVVLLATLSRIAPSMAYERRVSDLPAAAPSAPNVLLIVWDTVRASSLSVYGYGRPTSRNLEKWAGDAVVFDHASSTSPWTLPSHASMLTGRWPQEMSANWEQALDGQHQTLSEVLNRAGYLTGGFVANTYYCGHELGLARGFAHYEDYVVSPEEFLVSSTLVGAVVNSGPIRKLVGYHDNIPRRSAADITDQFLAWHATAGSRPFFAFLNFFDAHETYLPPAPFAGMFGPGPPAGGPAVFQELRRSFRRDWPDRPANEIQGEINMYDGAIAYLDDELNRLFNALRSRGVLDNTIVIVTSDHGEQFGEHQLFLHANSLYQPLLHVPLVIRFPPLVPEGRRIAARVTLKDLPATIVDLLRLPPEAAMPGSSLARHWDQTPTAAETDLAIAEVREADWAKAFPWYPTAKGTLESVTDDEHHYIRNSDGTEELYAIAEDPRELQDVSGQPDKQPVLERLRLALQNRRARATAR